VSRQRGTFVPARGRVHHELADSSSVFTIRSGISFPAVEVTFVEKKTKGAHIYCAEFNYLSRQSDLRLCIQSAGGIRMSRRLLQRR
jgi:hypothetical protein